MTNFEKDLRQNAQQQKESVDTDQLWNNIEPHLIKKRRNKAIPFWILFGVLLISVGITFLSKVNSPNTEISSFSKTTKKVIQEEEKTSIVIDDTFAKIKNAVSQINNKESEEFESNPSLLRTTISPLVNSSNSESSANDPTEVSIDKNELLSKGSLSRSNNSTLQNKSTDFKINTSITFSEAPFVFENKNHKTQFIVRDYNTFADKSKNKKKAPLVFQSLALRVNLLPNEISSPPLESKLSHGILVENRMNLEYYISGGISHSPLNLTLEDSEWVQQYANRLNAESRLTSWHLRAGIRKNIANNWSLKAGLLLAKIHGRSQTTLISTELIQLDDVIIERIISPKGVEDVYGSIEVNQTTTKEVRRISSSTGVDLNISLLKSLYLSSLASVYMGPMITYNLNYHQKGSIHPISNNEYNLEQDESDWFKSNLGLSLGIETGIRYQIKNNLKIEASFLFDYKLNNFNTSNNRIGDRRHTLHLGIGMSQSF